MKRKARGFFETAGGERRYTIDNVYDMEDFFLSLPSSSDIWVFLWSQGGITAGRKSQDTAIFPYYTDDKISDMKYTTGTFCAIRRGKKVIKLFDPKQKRKCSISMPSSLSEVSFTEKIDEYGLSFTLTWLTSNKYGLVKKLEINAEKDIEFTLLDGARNLLPSSIDSKFQNNNSTLLDAYKLSAIEEKSGLISLSLSSAVTDRAEPNEALLTNVSFFTTEGRLSLDSEAEEAFEDGSLSYENVSRGRRGAAFIEKEIKIKSGETYSHLQLFDVAYDSSDFLRLRSELTDHTREEIRENIEKDIKKTEERLEALLESADAYEDTGDEMASLHHKANVLFNIMRGGTLENKAISYADFLSFIKNRNSLITPPQSDKEELSYEELKTLTSSDRQLKRLFYEYIPLTFSRRHGDPSRPWNRFFIDVADKEGQAIHNYEGNWRDIFQNWEALALSHPEYLDHMISRFLDTMTADGYNPYRISRDGFDWEKSDPDDPWAQIGYWNDHQVIYLVRLLRLADKYGMKSLSSDLSTPRFSTANVPYRFKSYDEIEENPHSSIIFDAQKDKETEELASKIGSDGKLVLNADGSVQLVSLSTKLLQIIVSKLCNFVPGGGIWMNSQRPEWNDANNALAGWGLSVVSLAAVKQLLEYFKEQLTPPSVSIAKPVFTAFNKMCSVYQSYPENDKDRCVFVRKAGKIFEEERRFLYAEGFGSETVKMESAELSSMFSLLIKSVDKTLMASRRSDGLYHSYNLLSLHDDEMSVLPMKLQLEGQVSILSSGLLNAKEACALMDELEKSALHERYTGAYTLYPDKAVPLFWEKNNVKLEDPSLLNFRDKDGNKVLREDGQGGFHFAPEIRNRECLKAALGEKNEALEELYEETFNHKYFTGRSDSFFRYEGLGSVYWHMVSKLLLSLAELIENSPDGEREKLIEHYRKLRSSLGYKRPAASYGSFPFMPYSHTPAGMGAKQPGMTGQVKEEILSRSVELGASVRHGLFTVNPVMLEKREFKDNGTLSFKRFGVIVNYTLTEGNEVRISIDGENYRTGNSLTREETLSLISRKGEIKIIDVLLGEDLLR